MPTWLKILLAILLLGILLVAGAIFLGYRWFRAHGGELREGAEKVVAEGKEFGAGRDANVCVDEALKRGDKCGFAGMMCEVKVKLFLDNCIQAASVPADFCKGVPKQTNVVGSVKWQLEECARRGHPNEQRCTRMLQSVQQACARLE